MSTDENTRLRIRDHLVELMDETLADAIMESMPPIPWTDLATKADVARIDGRLNGTDGRLDGIDGRLDGIDGRLDGIDGRLDGIENTLVVHDHNFEHIDRRFDMQSTELQAGLTGLEGRLAMRFMEATRLMVFALLLLMTGVIATVIAVSDFS